ncbi:MAG TPA: tetratricopeptide repeat protein [Pyrinomonadaceae bacterium]
MMKMTDVFLLLLLLLIDPRAFPQTQQQTAAAAQTANALWQAQKWEEAAKAYESLTRSEPNNGQAWFRLGSSLMSLQNFDAAVAPLARAAEILRGPQAYYALGAAHAGTGNKVKSFESLRRAAETGFAQFERMKNDPHLAGLRDDAQFGGVLEAVERNARPCKFSPEAKQLDFWVGRWDVQVSGQSVGTNVIERLEEGCLIMENWSGRGGSTGRSMNFFNPVTNKWRQTYIGNNETIWEMSGEYKDGVMFYAGEMFPPRGAPVMVRVKFYNLSPDRVRHTQDNSTDGGKTWTNVWDATYVRKKEAATQ